RRGHAERSAPRRRRATLPKTVGLATMVAVRFMRVSKGPSRAAPHLRERSLALHDVVAFPGRDPAAVVSATRRCGTDAARPPAALPVRGRGLRTGPARAAVPGCAEGS